MRWILDDMVLGDLARAVPSAQMKAWPDQELFVADQTARDAAGQRKDALSARTHSGNPVIDAFSFSVSSPAGKILYTHLRSGSGGTANLAEHQSIAWALTDPEGKDSVLVTQDKHAALLALAELGRGRVCHPFEFWEGLLNRGFLTPAVFESLRDHTGKRDQSIPGIPWRQRR